MSDMESQIPFAFLLSFFLVILVIIITVVHRVACGTVVRGDEHRTWEEKLWLHMQTWIKLCDFGQGICLLWFIFSSSDCMTFFSDAICICLCFHTWLVRRAASSCTFFDRDPETIFLPLGSWNLRLFSLEDLQDQALNSWVPLCLWPFAEPYQTPLL